MIQLNRPVENAGHAAARRSQNSRKDTKQTQSLFYNQTLPGKVYLPTHNRTGRFPIIASTNVSTFIDFFKENEELDFCLVKVSKQNKEIRLGQTLRVLYRLNQCQIAKDTPVLFESDENPELPHGLVVSDSLLTLKRGKTSIVNIVSKIDNDTNAMQVFPIHNLTIIWKTKYPSRKIMLQCHAHYTQKLKRTFRTYLTKVLFKIEISVQFTDSLSA